jgi:hypothetical protein
MYSLTIHFGPNAMCWAFLFKEKEKADTAWKTAFQAVEGAEPVIITDDFGQICILKNVAGVLLEDLDLVEEARIQRSLYNARGEVKARQRASTDPVIRTAQGGAPILTPMGGFRQ